MKEFCVSVTFPKVIDSRALLFPGFLKDCPAKDVFLEFVPQAMLRLGEVSILLRNVQSQNDLLGHVELEFRIRD